MTVVGSYRQRAGTQTPRADRACAGGTGTTGRAQAAAAGPPAWKVWITTSKTSLLVERWLALGAGCAALFTALLVVYMLLGGGPIPYAAFALIPRVPLLAVGQLWVIALLNARVPRRGRGWRERMSIQGGMNDTRDRPPNISQVGCLWALRYGAGRLACGHDRVPEALHKATQWLARPVALGPSTTMAPSPACRTPLTSRWVRQVSASLAASCLASSPCTLAC